MRNVPSGRPSHRLPQRRNLALLASNVYETAPRSLFDPSATELNELLEVRFEFPFNLIGKLMTAFFNGLIMAPTQIRVQRRWPQNKDFVTDSQTDLTRGLGSSVSQVIREKQISR